MRGHVLAPRHRGVAEAGERGFRVCKRGHEPPGVTATAAVQVDLRGIGHRRLATATDDGPELIVLDMLVDEPLKLARIMKAPAMVSEARVGPALVVCHAQMIVAWELDFQAAPNAEHSLEALLVTEGV